MPTKVYKESFLVREVPAFIKFRRLHVNQSLHRNPDLSKSDVSKPFEKFSFVCFQYHVFKHDKTPSVYGSATFMCVERTVYFGIKSKE